MTKSTYTITTSLGSCTGTLREVCEWQAEHQAAYATIGGLDVSYIDFGDDTDAAIQDVKDAALRSLKDA
jgi:hypothetical protein